MNQKILKKMFFDLIRIRMVESSIAEYYPKKEMRCPVHLSIGQEPIAVGICTALKKDDYVMSSHRSHAHYLAKGGNLKTMLAEIFGKKTGCSGGRGGSMHLVDTSIGMMGSAPIVGSMIPVATGTAFGSWMKGIDRVSVVFFGDGATEEGVFSESLNFAALKKLPVIFVCENNSYSVYSPLSVRQPKERDRVGIAKAHGVEGFSGDGNHLEEIYRSADEAVNRARRGLGPTYLEFETYRWREHCGPNYDNDIGYRTEEEFRVWQEKCAVTKYRELLLSRGLLTTHELKAKEDEYRDEITRAFDFARSSPFPCHEN